MILNALLASWAGKTLLLVLGILLGMTLCGTLAFTWIWIVIHNVGWAEIFLSFLTGGGTVHYVHTWKAGRTHGSTGKSPSAP